MIQTLLTFRIECVNIVCQYSKVYVISAFDKLSDIKTNGVQIVCSYNCNSCKTGVPFKLVLSRSEDGLM